MEVQFHINTKKFINILFLLENSQHTIYESELQKNNNIKI